MSCGIYKITNKENGKAYIGQSVHIEDRWYKHKWESQAEGYPQYNYTIHKAFRKYGISAFTFEIIEECDQEMLDEREKYWIALYDTYMKGYNDTEGGDGGPIMKGEDNPRARLTDEDVFDIRNRALKCESQSEVYHHFYAEKISFRQFQRVWQGEGWEHILPEVADFIHSKEYLSAIKSNAAKKQITQQQIDAWTDIEKRKMNGEKRLEVYELYKERYSLSGFNKIWYKNKEGVKAVKKAVAKLDKDTEEVLDVYESAAEAGRQNACDASGISKVCRGVRPNCGGFKWRFYE